MLPILFGSEDKCINLYYLHRIDLSILFVVTMDAMNELIKEGKIKYVRVSEA